MKKPSIKKLNKAKPIVTCISVNRRSIDIKSVFRANKRYADKATKIKLRNRIGVNSLIY